MGHQELVLVSVKNDFFHLIWMCETSSSHSKTTVSVCQSLILKKKKLINKLYYIVAAQWNTLNFMKIY